MNDRLKELITKATDSVPSMVVNQQTFDIEQAVFQGKKQYRNELNVETLAELIVLECFKAAMIEAKGHMNPHDLMMRMRENVGIKNE